MHKPIAKLLCGLLPMLLASSLSATTVYQWKDEQGNIHFGSVPPAGASSQSMRLKTSSGVQSDRPGTDAAPPELVDEPSQAEIDRQVRQQAIAAENERRTTCTQLRTNLATMKNHSRLRVEIDGKAVIMSPQERQKRIQETEQQIREHCD